MFASRRDLVAPGSVAQSPGQNSQMVVLEGLPPQETPLATAKRWGLGVAYALQPQRIASVPHLLLWTCLDLIRGGTEIPDQTRTKSRPDTFAGVVRDLTPETYMAAVRLGFFPWAHCGPLKWWTRKKRSVLFFAELHVSRRLKRLMKSGKYRVTFDTAFDQVLKNCAAPRSYNWHTLTWLTPRFMMLFAELHRRGLTHSYEVWNTAGELVAGGFGTAAGKVFVGESMFSHEADASKLASIVLYAHLKRWGFTLVDARDRTPVLAMQGYRDIPRAEFEALMQQHAMPDHRIGRWTATISPAQALDVLSSAPDL
jgi:leucyl/phenylalanyl-tRNA--protein transferase